MGIEISLKHMGFINLVVRTWLGWEVHHYCFRGLEASLPGLSLHIQARSTDTRTLKGSGKVLAPESGWGTRAGAIWHVNKGSPVQEDWALAWWW